MWIGRLEAARHAELERERTEETLREREEHIRLLLDLHGGGDLRRRSRGPLHRSRIARARECCGAPIPASWSVRICTRSCITDRADGTPYPVEECGPVSRASRVGVATHVNDETFWRADGTSFSAEFFSFPMRRGDLPSSAPSSPSSTSAIARSWKINFGSRRRWRRLASWPAASRTISITCSLVITPGYSEVVTPNASRRRSRKRTRGRNLARRVSGRLAALTRQLLAFSRKQALTMSVLDLR